MRHSIRTDIERYPRIYPKRKLKHFNAEIAELGVGFLQLQMAGCVLWVDRVKGLQRK